MLNPQIISESSAAVRDKRSKSGTSAKYKSVRVIGRRYLARFQCSEHRIRSRRPNCRKWLQQFYYRDVKGYLVLFQSTFVTIREFRSILHTRESNMCQKHACQKPTKCRNSTRSFLYGENLIVMGKKHSRSF